MDKQDNSNNYRSVKELYDKNKLEKIFDRYIFLENTIKEQRNSFLPVFLNNYEEELDILLEQNEWIKIKKEELDKQIILEQQIQLDKHNKELYIELYNYISVNLLSNEKYKDYYDYIINNMLDNITFNVNTIEKLENIKKIFDNSIDYYKKYLIEYVKLKNLGIDDPSYAFLSGISFDDLDEPNYDDI